jgi:hypothetical protein
VYGGSLCYNFTPVFLREEYNFLRPCEKVFVWHARFASCENCCFCYLFLREILFLGLRLLLASEE